MQLYEFTGPHWTLPIQVEWHDVVAQVEIDQTIPLLPIQRTALEAELNRIGELRDGHWWIAKRVLDKFAVESRETSAEQVVEWRKTPQIPRRAEGVKFDADEFIEAYTNSQYAIIPDPLINEMIWLSLNKFMLHRLLNERKPIDLFFAKLVPLLVRKNWKEILLRREKKRPMAYSSRPSEIIKRGMADVMATDAMLAFDRESRGCRWTIEVIEQEPWRKTASRVESYRRKKAYLWNLREQLKRQLPYAIESYSAWLAEAALPFITVVGNEPSQSAGVKVRRQGEAGRVQHHPHCRQSCVVISEAEESGLESGVAIPLEALLAMSRVPSELPYMWELTGVDEPEVGDEHLSGSVEPAGEDHRVPMLDAF